MEQEGENNLGLTNGTAACQTAVSMAVINDTKVTTICEGQNFTNINDLQAWISPNWTGDYT